MIHAKEDKVTLIIYDSPEPPKIFKVSKKVVRVALFTTPIILVVSLLTSLIYSIVIKRNLVIEKSKEPALIKELQEENNSFQKEIEELKQDRESLTQKISSRSETTASADFLPLFSKPLGFQDKTNLNLIRIDNIRYSISADSIIFNFDLHNNGPSNSRVAGRIFVVYYSPGAVQIYPKNSSKNLIEGLNFTQGEKFVASRFRPSESSFGKPQNLQDNFFKIIVFSNLGDLTYTQTVGPVSFEGN